MYSQEVLQWQTFLIGFFTSINQSLGNFVADGLNGPKTIEATKSFQKRVNIPETGEIDKKTKEAAADYGFGVATVLYPPPKNITMLSGEEKEKLFGKFSYVPAPTDGNPEGIRITDNWVAGNIVSIQVPGLDH
ncbi:peptidoglycan-binding protein, partial [bacterium]|nr:peptidoglycan-binding protein [bacterium]